MAVTARGLVSALFAIGLAATAIASPADAGAAEPAPRPPAPRLITNNDLSNWTIFAKDPPNAPESASPEEVRDGFLASLRFSMSPGVDAQSLSPLYSTFPFWKSAIYTLADHDAFLAGLPFYRDTAQGTGFPGPRKSSLRRALDAGVDFVDLFARTPLATADGRPAQKILSFRVDDAHYTHVYDVYRRQTRDDVLKDAAAGRSPMCDTKTVAGVDFVDLWAQTAFTGWYAGFASGRLPPPLGERCTTARCVSPDLVARDCAGGACVLVTAGSRCPTVTLSFASEAVRRFKLMQIEDLIGHGDVETLELDFDRFPRLFPDTVPPPERAAILLGWLSQVRTATHGLRLGLRVPSRLAHRAALGIDLRAVAERGLADYAILAMPYFADQQVEAEIDPAATPMGLYAEMTHQTGAPAPDAALARAFALGADARVYEQFTTSRQLVTAAHLAWSRGFAGMALFNMQYYLRPSSGAAALDYPTAAVACMADASCAAAGDQEYVLPSAHYHLTQLPDMLPFRVASAAPPHTFTLRMAPPRRGWADGVLVSIGFDVETGATATAAPILEAAGRELSISVNGHAGRPVDASAWPADPRDGERTRAFAARYWLDRSAFRRVFAFRAEDLRAGANDIAVAWPGTADGRRVRIRDFRLFAPALP
jgi:hypothetical protein